ncbi:class I SAM-dependent methyltransferase [Nonomuraea glycinis]|uniref:class I SAM-dependent methyltransferase n=1 Tax=Nonomuraea glycinis TaxID=2047744 RepID=UPI0033A9D124
MTALVWSAMASRFDDKSASASNIFDGDQLRLWNSYHRQYWNSEERIRPTSSALVLADGLSRGRRILELGCGSGRDAVFLQRRGHAVTATDFSEFAIEANLHSPEASEVDFSLHDLRAPLAFSAASFDVAYARLALHYFPDSITRDVFREIHRVLRPAGKVFFVCRSTDDVLFGQGEEIGPDLFRSDGQIRHFFSQEYTKDVLSAEGLFAVDSLVLRDELVYGSHASVVQCLAERSRD